MKKSIITLFGLLLSIIVFAQSPEGFKYQAVVRNTSGAIVSNQAIGMQVRLRQGTSVGTIVYEESFTPTSNAYGLVNMTIGAGTVSLGTFASIDWSAGPYFVEIGMDITGGTAYTVMGTSQLMSVPYALYAKTAESITGTMPLSIGDSYQGGIIFWLDSTGKHGLIAATVDQSPGIIWWNGTYRYTGTTGNGLYAGSMNTPLIIATQMADNQTGNFAAKICNDYSVTVGSVTYGDWYLPSVYELNLLKLQKNVVGGFSNNAYWSSTEDNNFNGWIINFSTSGSQGTTDKGNPFYVRAIRAF